MPLQAPIMLGIMLNAFAYHYAQILCRHNRHMPSCKCQYVNMHDLIFVQVRTVAVLRQQRKAVALYFSTLVAS